MLTLMLASAPDPWWLNALQGLGLFLFFALLIASLVGVFFGLPGLWVIVAEALVYALVTRFQAGIGWWDLAALLALAGAAEGLELLITMKGTERSGGSRWEAVAAVVGGIAGAMLLNLAVPVVGAILGAFIGVFLGAFMVAYYRERNFDRAMAVGFGAFKGRLGAVLVKETLGVAMAVVIIWQMVAA